MRMAPLLFVGILVLAACGSDAVEPDEYGDSVEALGRDYEERSTALQVSLHDDLQIEIDRMFDQVDQGDAEAVAAFAAAAFSLTVTRTTAFFAGLGDALHVYRVDLAEARPPEEYTQRHDELLAAIDGVLAGLPALLEDLPQVGEFGEIDGTVNGSAFSDAQPRLRAACLALESALIDAGVAVNLRCPT